MNGEDRPNRPIGARPKGARIPNPMNAEIRARAAQRRARRPEVGRNEVQQPPGTDIPDFEIDTVLDGDRTLIPGVVGPVTDQFGKTCASVAICRLHQALYNDGKTVALHHRFCVRDLADYVKKKTGSQAIKNLKIAYDYAFRPGLLKLSDINRSNVGGHGLRIRAQYDENKSATKQEVYDKFNETSIAICIAADMDFCRLKHDIYKIPMPAIAARGSSDVLDMLEHAMLVVAKGETKSGEDFLVVQNSWGLEWGNRGYGRIWLNPLGRFRIFWATQVVKR